MKYKNYNEYKKEYARRRADRVTVCDIVKAGLFGFFLAYAFIVRF